MCTHLLALRLGGKVSFNAEDGHESLPVRELVLVEILLPPLVGHPLVLLFGHFALWVRISDIYPY